MGILEIVLPVAVSFVITVIAGKLLIPALVRLKAVPDVTDAAYVIRDVVLQKMAELRVVCDEAETLTAAKYWPFPTYGDLLFGVR